MITYYLNHFFNLVESSTIRGLLLNIVKHVALNIPLDSRKISNDLPFFPHAKLFSLCLEAAEIYTGMGYPSKFEPG